MFHFGRAVGGKQYSHRVHKQLSLDVGFRRDWVEASSWFSNTICLFRRGARPRNSLNVFQSNRKDDAKHRAGGSSNESRTRGYQCKGGQVGDLDFLPGSLGVLRDTVLGVSLGPPLMRRANLSNRRRWIGS